MFVPILKILHAVLFSLYLFLAFVFAVLFFGAFGATLLNVGRLGDVAMLLMFVFGFGSSLSAFAAAKAHRNANRN